MLRAVGGSAEQKAESHPNIIYTVCKDRFGVEEKKPKKTQQKKGPSRRQEKCKTLREEINKLKDAYKEAPEEEKEAIDQLQQEKLRKLRLAKRAETMKINREKAKKSSDSFLRNPFEFARKVLSPEVKGDLRSTKEEVEKHLSTAHSDSKRGDALEIPHNLWEYQEPTIEFNNQPPAWREFQQRVRKARSKSAPGPNGIPYKVYKKCPGVARVLWLYLRGIWKKNIIISSWRKAEGVFIPKENGATSVDKYRTISLSNVEGKLYLGLKADKLLSFILSNGYIDTSIQKGGIPAVSGCLEHTALLSQLIREAKSTKGDLVVNWLDIANAFGSLAHQLIFTALRRAHVPEHMCQLIESYYSDVNIRFTTNQFTTEWQRIEKGIITGCTLSVVLFTLAMTMLVMSVKGETRGPKTVSGQMQQNARLFMDDITTTTNTKVQSSHLLRELAGKLEWGRLKVKPGKCRSLVIQKGAVSKSTIDINGEPITSITEKPIKYLGKTYNLTMGEKEQIEDAVQQVTEGLKKIEKSKVSGRYKCWMVQFMLLPRIMWPLTIYNVPMTKIEEVQRKITVSLKRWLKLPNSLSADVLYSRTTKAQLPYTSLAEEVKATKARQQETLTNSSDECVRNAKINIDGGRKWKAAAAVEEAKSRLRLQDIAGIANIGREGLGVTHRQYYGRSTDKEKRSLIVAKIREKEEEERHVRISTLTKQGASMKWEVPAKKISHKEIISTTDTRLRFLMKSVYDLLPTPANKNQWFSTEEFNCTLCGGKGTLNHILSGCRVALQQGRYRWRHDKVLKELAYWIDERRKAANKKRKQKRKWINFVKAGVKGKAATSDPDSYLNTAADWELRVDLGRQLKVPTYIATTDLRPDMLLMSDRTKQIAIIELTVPAEDRIGVSAELKKAKYAVLEDLCRRSKWKPRVWTVEVGCRGFAAGSVAALLRDLGYAGRQKKHIITRIETEAESASHNIWKWSHFKQWGEQKD